MGLLGGALLSAQWRVCRFGVPDVNPQAVLKRAYLRRAPSAFAAAPTSRMDCPGYDSCPKRRLHILFHRMKETSA